jgi:hypothetical protein
MLTKNDVAKVYDTILSIPGMNETVKIDLKISRKNVLLLTQIIERGLARGSDNDHDDGLLGSVPSDSLEQLKLIAAECLQKSGMVELSERLTTLANSK